MGNPGNHVYAKEDRSAVGEMAFVAYLDLNNDSFQDYWTVLHITPAISKKLTPSVNLQQKQQGFQNKGSDFQLALTAKWHLSRFGSMGDGARSGPCCPQTRAPSLRDGCRGGDPF